MEDMARLAVVEQSVRDSNKYSKILYELLLHINNILENPHDYELRTIKSDVLKELLMCDAFNDYLKYVGFQPDGTKFIYPREHTLSNLRIAQAAIERKIGFCCGPVNLKSMSIKSTCNAKKKTELRPSHIMKTTNPLLLQIESLFNSMIIYEDEELQALAREQIPIVTLQLMALDRVREQQKKIKTGELKDHDLPFDVALLIELLGWFKYKFFSWVDKPDCEKCGGPTVFTHTSSLTTETETCRVEVYKCPSCEDSRPQFPRYNDVRALLRTRRGRCGEWANCFTLMCRALGYDTRRVLDTADHVWCEVFDYDSNTWLHADPCEAKLNAPLMYCHGWGKKPTYVFAASRDDLQDVTWRYTMNHKEVLKMRNQCDEKELLLGILALREHRQRQVSEARRRYLAKRSLEELVQLMVERTPGDYESQGRTSGSVQWRKERGELGKICGHSFELDSTGRHTVRYHSSTDLYRLQHGDKLTPIATWSAGAFNANNIFRKVEKDWRMAYLAREDGDTSGTVSWRFSTRGDLLFEQISISVRSATFESGCIQWTLQFDDEKPVSVTLSDTPTLVSRRFCSVIIQAVLSGGAGDVRWQHAQLFRQSLDDKTCTFEVSVTVATDTDRTVQEATNTVKDC